jgi:hypothetical protein
VPTLADQSWLADIRQITQGGHDVPHGHRFAQIRTRSKLGRKADWIAGRNKEEGHTAFDQGVATGNEVPSRRWMSNIALAMGWPSISASARVVSPADGIAQEAVIATGDGHTMSFTVSAPTGPYAPIGCTMMAPTARSRCHTELRHCFRPVSTAGIASAAGYRISTGGYGAASRAEYASMSMVTGAPPIPTSSPPSTR